MSGQGERGTTINIGDCLVELPKLNAESVDLLCTDPPYGLSFMGKDWDRAVPSVEIWKECFRVLKTGAFAFVMSSPRLDVLSQMAIRLSDAGFNTGFTPIYWAYASGFPKATNISKAVDKKLGFEREVIGNNTNARPNSDARYINKDEAIYGGGSGSDHSPFLTSATSPQAKLLDGSYAGFQPKPAVEVVIVAMKPLSEKTYVEQALKNQKGITWLDEGRIPFQSEQDRELGLSERPSKTTGDMYGKYEPLDRTDRSDIKGRFMANLLVSDDVLNDGSVQGGQGHFAKHGASSGYRNGWAAEDQEERYLTDSGSFSRYFSLDAWWNERIKSLPESVRKTFPFLIVPKAGKRERNEGLEGFEEKFDNEHPSRGYDYGLPDLRMDKPQERKPNRNIHATVKPIKLMSYLITLGSRPQDIILDPFMGSGTTGIACKMLNRKFIGYEIDPESFKIAEARIRANRQVNL